MQMIIYWMKEIIQKYATRHEIDVQESHAKWWENAMNEQESASGTIIEALDRWVVLKSKNEADRPGHDCLESLQTEVYEERHMNCRSPFLKTIARAASSQTSFFDLRVPSTKA